MKPYSVILNVHTVPQLGQISLLPTQPVAGHTGMGFEAKDKKNARKNTNEVCLCTQYKREDSVLGRFTNVTYRVQR